MTFLDLSSPLSLSYRIDEICEHFGIIEILKTFLQVLIRFPIFDRLQTKTDHENFLNLSIS